VVVTFLGIILPICIFIMAKISNYSINYNRSNSYYQ